MKENKLIAAIDKATKKSDILNSYINGLEFKLGLILAKNIVGKYFCLTNELITNGLGADEYIKVLSVADSAMCRILLIKRDSLYCSNSLFNCYSYTVRYNLVVPVKNLRPEYEISAEKFNAVFAQYKKEIDNL